MNELGMLNTLLISRTAGDQDICILTGQSKLHGNVSSALQSPCSWQSQWAPVSWALDRCDVLRSSILPVAWAWWILPRS